MNLLDPTDRPPLRGAARRRHRAGQQAHRVLIEVGLGGIARGEADAPLDDAARARLLGALARIRPASTRSDIHNAIDHALARGRALGLWTHPGIGTATSHPFVASPIATTDADALRAAMHRRDALARALPGLPTDLSPLVRQGLVTYALVYFDALLAAPLLQALAEARTQWQRDDVLLVHGDARGVARLRRWRFGAVTRPLVRRWRRDHPVAGPTEAALEAAAQVLGIRGLPTSVVALLREARLYWAPRLPPFLLALATDAQACESLPPRAHRRLFGGRGPLLPDPARGDAPALEIPTAVVASGQVLQSPRGVPARHWQAWRALRHALDVRETGRGVDPRGVADLQLAAWQQAHAGIGGWTVLMAAWARHALGQARGRALMPSSIRRYMAYGRWLVQLAADLDPATVEAEELLERLTAMAAHLAEQRGGFLALLGLQELLDFRAAAGAPAVDLSEYWDLPAGTGRPRANLVTHREYVDALAILDARSDGSTVDRDRALLHLLYGAGLRWGEAANVRIADVRQDGHGDWRGVWLTVRRSKTANGLRTLPLHQLLGPDALQELETFVGQRQGQWSHLPDARLFAEADAALAAPGIEVRERLVDALRRASGDAAITLHALRHGVANALMLRLWGVDPARSGQLAMMMHAGSARPGAYVSDHEWLTDHRTRGAHTTAALAALIGHLDAQVTRASYLHLTELVLAEATAAHPPRIPRSILAALCGLKPQTLRQRAWRANAH
ncbi:MAG: site-specific integrase [Pseudoxanthomonas suwonensis]|nr:site-specific integrase [Pseudoxanthomonas suwonensis]